MQGRPSFWSFKSFAFAPFRHTAKAFLVVARIGYGLFLFSSGLLKIFDGWLNTSTLRDEFERRIVNLPPESFQSLYLEWFAIPAGFAIAWIIVWGQVASGVALVIGKFERSASILTLFLYANFSLGGYFFWQAIPTYLLPLLFLAVPSGRMWGFDAVALRRAETLNVQGEKNED